MEEEKRRKELEESKKKSLERSSNFYLNRFFLGLSLCAALVFTCVIELIKIALDKDVTILVIALVVLLIIGFCIFWRMTKRLNDATKDAEGTHKTADLALKKKKFKGY